MSNGTMDFDLVINNRKLVIPPDIISSSIGIKGEKIAAIATDLSGFPAKKTIDAIRRTRPGAGRKNGAVHTWALALRMKAGGGYDQTR